MLLIYILIIAACISSEWKCDNDKCIKASYRNDGDNDCGDWSDEGMQHIISNKNVAPIL